MAKMQTGFSQQQNLQLTQKLSPQMIQSISLMALSVPELSDKIYEEVEKNPALEIIQDANLYSGQIRITKKNNDNRYGGNTTESDNHQAFIESAPSREQSLQEALLLQLTLLHIGEEERDLCRRLISNLDNHGYFVEDINVILKDDESTELLNKALEIVQSLEPAGVCCKDLQESLILQTKRLEKEMIVPILTMPILKDFFDTLERPRPTLVKNKLIKGYDKSKFLQEKIDIDKIETEDVEQAIAFIQNLDPFPARQFASNSPTKYITPDVRVRKATDEEFSETGKKFVVEFLKGNLPQLELSSSFIKYAGKDKIVDDALRDAKWFINSIEQRNITLIKTVSAILEFQKAFFSKGPRFLQPLRMKDVAEKVGVHESTISRISNSKYVQTEWGLFEISYFFTNAVSVSVSNKRTLSEKDKRQTGPSKESVKQEILLILENETEKLSDSKLASILDSRGIKISRRTVAKYRTELNIKSSFDRDI
ncbi:MAG: RNA polymerase factor sigma-54 [Treponema sp.]|nr:RNA polymerase factor sigma-54 [Treponema sp.]